MDVYEIRRERLREVMRARFDNKQAAIADAIGVADNYVSRMLSAPTKAGHKRITGDFARQIEQRANLPRGFLDGDADQAHSAKNISEDRPNYSGNRIVRVHDMTVTLESLEFAQEWDKLRDPYRQQISQLVMALVAEQKRGERKTPDKGPKGPKSQPSSRPNA